MKKVLIFDFDGTIADSLWEIVKIVNEIANKSGIQKIDKVKLDQSRNQSSDEIFKKLGIPKLKLLFIIREAKKKFNERICNVKSVKGIKSVLCQLKDNGYTMGILTSNSADNIKKFLKNNNLDFFDFIYSENNLFGKDRVIKKILKKNKFIKKDVFYIGDETRDIEAAKRSGVKVIAVGWGFNTRDVLMKYEPDYLAENPRELINIIQY